MHILFTGGGSGGHIFPNIALLRKLKEQNSSIQISYIGEKNSMEETLISKESIPFYSIKAGKLRRYFSFQNALDVFKVITGIFQSILLIKRLKPDVVFSKGGYVSLPVVVAAKILGKRIVIHESDVVPGLTTHLSSRFASTICVSWERTKAFFKGKNVVLTGIPVRSELTQGSKEQGRKFAGIEENSLPTVTIIGGSLGAARINAFIIQHLPALLKEYNIIHIVGKGKSIPVELESDLKSRYAQIEFVGEEMKDIFALTDIFISRASATALAEFIFAGKPVIMIPLPRSQSRGDQFDNAEEFVKMYPDIGRMVDENLLTIEYLLPTLQILHQGFSIKTENTSAVECILKLIVA